MCELLGQRFQVSTDSCGESYSSSGTLLQDQEDAGCQLEIVSVCSSGLAGVVICCVCIAVNLPQPLHC